MLKIKCHKATIQILHFEWKQALTSISSKRQTIWHKLTLLYYATQKKSDTCSNVILVHLFEMNFIIQGLFSTERLNIQLARHLNRLLRPYSGVWNHTERGGILGWGHSKSGMQTSAPSTVVGLSLDKVRFFSKNKFGRQTIDASSDF